MFRKCELSQLQKVPFLLAALPPVGRLFLSDQLHIELQPDGAMLAYRRSSDSRINRGLPPQFHFGADSTSRTGLFPLRNNLIAET